VLSLSGLGLHLTSQDLHQLFADNTELIGRELELGMEILVSARRRIALLSSINITV